MESVVVKLRTEVRWIRHVERGNHGGWVSACGSFEVMGRDMCGDIAKLVKENEH